MIGRKTRFVLAAALATTLMLASADFAQATTVIKAVMERTGLAPEVWSRRCRGQEERRCMGWLFTRCATVPGRR